LKGGVGDHPEADALALADLDRVGDLLPRLAGLLLDLPLDLVDQLLGLLVAAVDEQPAGALGDVAPHQQDAQAEDGAKAEGDPPADVGGEQVLVQQHQRQGGPEHLVDGRVDGRALPADAGPGEEPAGVEPQRVHRERGQHRRHQVQDEGDDEQLLAAEPVSQKPKNNAPRQAPRT
jgi:hypothetical protein